MNKEQSRAERAVPTGVSELRVSSQVLWACGLLCVTGLSPGHPVTPGGLAHLLVSWVGLVKRQEDSVFMVRPYCHVDYFRFFHTASHFGENNWVIWKWKSFHNIQCEMQARPCGKGARWSCSAPCSDRPWLMRARGPCWHPGLGILL